MPSLQILHICKYHRQEILRTLHNLVVVYDPMEQPSTESYQKCYRNQPTWAKPIAAISRGIPMNNYGDDGG